MDILSLLGTTVNSTFQGLGGWLTEPMKFFSFLGSEDFFLLALPLVYWCLDASLGLKIGVMLLASNSLNGLLKMAMHGPRPYWVSTEVKGMAAETGFGVPSGHAQTAAGVWGIAAAGISKSWAWITAVLVILLIGLSRIYLGVHFLHDVLLGWILGGLTLWAFIKLWNPAAARLKKMSMGMQILLAFIVSLAVILLAVLIVFLSRNFVIPADWIANATRGGAPTPDPFNLEGTVTSMGTLFGLLAGIAWLAPRGGFQASGPTWKRALRYVVGLVGVAVFYIGLKMVFPDGEDLVALVFRYIRYMLVGVWTSAGAPWVFSKMGLAENPR
jgi:membrane-associated phospholipid phosphatase